MLTLEDIKGLKVTVMGLGLNGGGFAAAKFFAEHGANVTVTDMKSEVDLAPTLQKLTGFKDIRFVLGRHEIADFQSADLVIKNPAVKRAANIYLDAAKKIESDISVFLQLSNAPLLAVTGSKGKSSTVNALYYGLKNLGTNAFLGGNITVSPLTFLSEVNERTPVVLELSSFQLADLRGCPHFHPSIAVITPIVPDHQNWYHDMASYVADKKVIYQNQNASDYTICNLDDGWGVQFSKETKGTTAFYAARYHSNFLPTHAGTSAPAVYFNQDGEGILRRGNEEALLLPRDTKVLSFPLKQNVLNAALALYLYGMPLEKIPPVMKDYPGLEHRLELFFERGAVQFYNDTTATVPEAAIAALTAFAENADRFEAPILITGGTDKGLHFEHFGREAKKAARIYLLEGTATNLMIEEFRKNNTDFFGPFDSPEPLLRALQKDITAKTATEKNGECKKLPVLFSPASTSFGMFQNEFDRGRQFKALVKKIFG